jgi:hypothetical protein
LCINRKSRAERPSLYETICLSLNPMEYGNFDYGVDAFHRLLLLLCSARS